MAGLRLLGFSELLLLRRLPIGLGLGDAGLGGDGCGGGTTEVGDVAGCFVALLDLQGVDDQPELFHLGAR
jgi:hypothetical protein